jgi:hypothetical protein
LSSVFDIPQDDPPAPTIEGSGTWLDVNQGKLAYKDFQGEAQSTDKVKGVFRRVWKAWDEGNKDAHIDPGDRLEIEIDTPNEKFLLRARAWVFIYAIAPNLAKVKEGDVVFIRVRPGRNPKITLPTVFVHSGTEWVEIREDQIEGESEADRIAKAWKLIEAHPAYRKPEVTEETEGAAEATGESWSPFFNAVLAKGWPAWQDAEKEYLAMIGQIGNATYAGKEGVPAEIWEKSVVAVNNSQKTPKMLQAVLDKKAAGGDYNPFEDE